MNTYSELPARNAGRTRTGTPHPVTESGTRRRWALVDCSRGCAWQISKSRPSWPRKKHEACSSGSKTQAPEVPDPCPESREVCSGEVSGLP